MSLRTPLHRRWWFAALLLALTAGIYHWNDKLREVIYEQQRVTIKLLTLCLGGAILWFWLILFSPLSRRFRRNIALTSAVLGLCVVALFEVRGFSGDLVPIISLRGSPRGPSLQRTTSTPNTITAVDTNPIWRNSPQFMGMERDACVRGVRLAQAWEDNPPVEVWRRAVGPAWSGFAVSGRRAITLEQRGQEEAIVCYGALDGEERWVHKVAAQYTSEIAGDGPRSTPTIAGQRVLATGATGILSCLELATGKELWSVDLLQQNQAKLPEWGYSCSPWVSAGQVVVSPGDLQGVSLVAYDVETGERRWSGGADNASYSSPSQYKLAGIPQFVSLNARSLSGIDPRNGKLLWSTEWDFDNPNVCQPLLLPRDRVFVSSGYGAGCALFQITRDNTGNFGVQREWKSLNLKSKLSSYVHKGGYVYGLDDGILTCVHLASGRRIWKSGRYGHGQIILVGEVLLIVSEEGRLLLVAASADKLKELGSIQALSGKVWNPPAFAAPLLYLRNDEEAVCYRLPLM